MARKGKVKVPKIDPKLDHAHIGSTLDSFLEEEGIAVAPTTLCTDHVVDSETPPYFCALCGKPLPTEAVEKALKAAANKGAEFKLRDRTDEWEERIDAARQSEDRLQVEGKDLFGNVKTYPLSVVDELRTDENALDEFLTEDEKQAPYAAVLTAEQLDAVLDEKTPVDPPEPRCPVHGTPLVNLAFFTCGCRHFTEPPAKPAPRFLASPLAKLDEPPKPALDGWQHILVAVLPLWHQRAVSMAEAEGITVADFIERLIKRQWIASGAGKGRR